MLTTLTIQSWILYAISISLISSRLIYRRITLGNFKKLQADDWLMLLLLLPYTASIVLANQVGRAQSTAERKSRYVLEEMHMITTWLVKACLLVLYWRIFPVQTSILKRRTIQGIALFCSISFLIVQSSLMLWCQPTEAHWSNSTGNPQCQTYHNHTALSLSLDTPNTILILILPVSFIPTPRRTLLAILLTLGTLVLATSITSRATILARPASRIYLHAYAAESTLAIVFANLPFLTPLIITAAPARIRQLSLSQWPRSRRGSWDTDARVQPVLRASRFDSVTSTLGEAPASVELKKGPEWQLGQADREENARSRDSGAVSPRSSLPAVPCTPAMRPETRDSMVPKMRLSGGLAEMGELSLQDTMQGWPIYWR